MLGKKHIAGIIVSVIALVIVITCFTERRAYAQTDSEKEEILWLSGIMTDQEGDLVIDHKYITRAEFAQLLVQASQNAVSVPSTLRSKIFKDLPEDPIQSEYIKIAVTKGYMSGYLNGKYQPNKAINLKEAIYGLLAVLGYINEDFVGKLSEARYIKYKELGLGDDIPLDDGDKINRQSCIILFYNLLNAKTKTGEVYATKLGISLDSKGRVDYEALLELKTKGPVVATEGWEKILKKQLSAYTIIQNDKKITEDEIEENSIVYYSEQAMRIWVYTERVYGYLEGISYNQGEPQELVVDGKGYSISNPQSIKKILKSNGIKKGTLVALLLGRLDRCAYVAPIKTIVAAEDWRDRISFSFSKGKLYKNNELVDEKDIKKYDMVYYCNELKTLWIFDQKILGTLNNILMENTEPKQLTISGESYIVEDSLNIKKRIEEKSIKTGIPVVLLLGWEDKVADINKIYGTKAEGDWQKELDFNLSSGVLYKNGTRIDASGIDTTDVVYYCNELKAVWAFNKRVFGTLKTIAPSRSVAKSVVVAGETYDLEQAPVAVQNETGAIDTFAENDWGRRLRDYGIKEGDQVVVQFGYDGLIADICAVDRMPVTITGYVLQTENKVVNSSGQGSSLKNTVRIIDTQGIIRELPCNDLLIVKGMLVEVSFTNGQPVFQRIDTTNYKIPSDINTMKLAENIRILSIDNQGYATMTPQELKEMNWTSANVYYYKTNSNAEITDLILRLVTNAVYQFGLMSVAFPGDESSEIYFTFRSGDNEMTLPVEEIRWPFSQGPKAFLIQDRKLMDVQELTEVTISYISENQANTGSAVYKIADDVQVYFSKDGKYYTGSLSDLTNFDGRVMKGYYSSQGPIRIIIITGA